MASSRLIWRRRSSSCYSGSTATKLRNPSTAHWQTSESPPTRLPVSLHLHQPISKLGPKPSGLLLILMLPLFSAMLTSICLTSPRPINSSVLVVFSSAAAAAAALSDRSPHVNLSRSTSSASGIHRSTEDLRSRPSSSLGRLRESQHPHQHTQTHVRSLLVPVTVYAVVTGVNHNLVSKEKHSQVHVGPSQLKLHNNMRSFPTLHTSVSWWELRNRTTDDFVSSGDPSAGRH